MMLAAMYHTILAFFFTIVALVLMVVILLQRGRGVGLAGAFGGTGGHTTFGAKTGDVLTWVTIVMAGFFLLFAVVLNYVFVRGTPGLAAPKPPAGQQPTSGPAEQEGHALKLPDAADGAAYVRLPIFGEAELS